MVYKLESFLSLDIKWYIKNSMYLILTNIIIIVSNFLLSVALARLLTKELYGLWNFIFSILSILAIFTLPGMNIAITQAVARGYDRVLIEGIKEKFKWSMLGSIVISGVGAYYFLNSFTLLGMCFMISSLFFPFYQIFQTYTAFLYGKMQFNIIAKYHIILQILSILVVLPVIYLTRNLIFILITYLTCNVLLNGYFLQTTLKKMKNHNSDKEAISFGKHLTLQIIPSEIIARGDMIIIGVLLGFPELAVYSIAKGFSTVIKMLMMPIISLTFPKLAKMSEENAYLVVKKNFLYLVIFTIIVCGILIALCPYIITFIYSQKYTDSILYTQILLVSLIFGIPTTIFGKALFPSQRKVKELYKIKLFHTGIELPILIILILKFGLLGVVVAKVLSNLLVMIYSCKLARINIINVKNIKLFY